MSQRNAGRIGRRGRSLSLADVDTQESVFQAIRSGVPVSYAGPAAGIGQRTVWKWLAAGRDAHEAIDAGETLTARDRIAAEFLTGVEAARAASVHTFVGIIGKAARGGQPVKERRYRDSVTGNIVTETDYTPPDWRAAARMLDLIDRRLKAGQQVEVAEAEGAAVQVAAREITQAAASLRVHVKRALEAVEPGPGC